YAQAQLVADASGKTPEAIGFATDAIDDLYDRMLTSLSIDPKTASIFQPAMDDFRMFKTEARVLFETSAVDPLEYEGVQSSIELAARNLEQMPQFTKKGQKAAKATWEETRQNATTNASKEYLNTFTDYTNQNMMDSFMKSIFPFWTYESQRYPFLAHLSMSRPGTAATLGRWMDYTDGGYVNLFGTPIDLNPFRGSVWMGGFRRFLMKDYPEFFDAPGFAGVAEVFDAVSRGGFYPNILITGSLSLWGSKEKGAQIFELLTPPFTTMLNTYYAIDSSSEFSRHLQENIFPDRFRDYMLRQALIGAGYEGDVIMAKRAEGFELTEAEQVAVDAANKRVSLIAIPSTQFGLFRYHEPDRNAAYEAALAVRSQLTGVPVDDLKLMNMTSDITGSSASDKFPLSIEDQQTLRDTEVVEKWNKNITAPLMPSTWSRQDDLVTLYYDRLTEISELARTTGFDDYTTDEGILISWDFLDAEFSAGRMSGKQYDKLSVDLITKTAIRFQGTKEEDVFANVPKTYEERVARNLERGGSAYIRHPSAELLLMFRELQPRTVWDAELEQTVTDYDSYFAQVDQIIEAMNEDHRAEFLRHIQREWSDTRQLRWQVNRSFFLPYRNARVVVLNRYSSEEQILIQEYS
ncbi:hypothetical protein LCGC14_2182280, partial [marine sediment metagenome]